MLFIYFGAEMKVFSLQNIECYKSQYSTGVCIYPKGAFNFVTKFILGDKVAVTLSFNLRWSQ